MATRFTERSGTVRHRCARVRMWRPNEVTAMFRRLMMIWLALGATVFAQQNPARQPPAPQNADWTRPFPPFHIIGNIYWVGSYDLSTYLITTPQGNILINTGVGDTAQQIKRASNSSA